MLSEYEKSAIRMAVREVVLQMAERRESINPAVVRNTVLNYHQYNLQAKIGADRQREHDYNMEIDGAVREASDMVEENPEELRRLVRGEGKGPGERGVFPEAPHEARAYAGEAPGITRFGAVLAKQLVVEPLGTEPAAKHNIHPALYDPRPEHVEEWIKNNVPNPHDSIEAYHAHLHVNMADQHMDPYRASWDALRNLRSLPPAKRAEIQLSIEPAKAMLKQKILRDALVFDKIEIRDVIRIVKPSEAKNLLAEYETLFKERYKKYYFNDTTTNLSILIDILPQEEKRILATVVKGNKELYETAVMHGFLKPKPPGSGAGGRTFKLRLGQRMPRMLRRPR